MHVSSGLGGEEYDRVYTDGQLIRRSAEYFRPHRRTVIAVIVTVVLISIVATLTPMLIARGIDALEGNRGLQLVLALAGVVTVLGMLNWAFNLVRVELGAKAVGDVVLALRENAFRAVMRHDLSFYDQYAAGRIVSRVTSDTQDFATVITLTVDLMSQLVLIVVIATVMLVVNVQLALVTLAVGPVVIIIALVFRNIARRAMLQAQRSRPRSTPRSMKRSTASPSPRTFARKPRYTTTFRRINRLAYSVQLRRMIVFGSIHPLMHARQRLRDSADHLCWWRTRASQLGIGR